MQLYARNGAIKEQEGLMTRYFKWLHEASLQQKYYEMNTLKQEVEERLAPLPP